MYLALILVIILLVPACLLLAPLYLSFYLNIEGFSICGLLKVKWFGQILYKRDLSFPEDDGMGADRGFRSGYASFPKDACVLIDAVFAFLRILKALIGSIHVEQLLCKVTFGLNDPADTAIMSGYLWALACAVSLPGTCIQVYPYFRGERLAGSLNAKIRGRLLWVFVAIINAIRAKPIRLLFKELIRNHRDKNNANAIEL